MRDLWFTRVRLKRDASVAALAPLLLPDRDDDRVSNGHRLMWSLFAQDSGQGSRDFLWREDASGWFYVLSRRPPPNEHPLLEVDAPKNFAPALREGDILRFSLRANATVSRPKDDFRTQNRDAALKPSRKTAHHDVVMHAIRDLPDPERAQGRQIAIQRASRAWLEGQAARCGFVLPPALNPDDDDAFPNTLRVDGYRVLRPPRQRRGAEMRIGVVDFEGLLTVTEPERFLASLATGFGRAKAYGCGLMLIKRV